MSHWNSSDSPSPSGGAVEPAPLSEQLAEVDAQLLALAARRLKLSAALESGAHEGARARPARETGTLRGLLAQATAHALEPDFVVDLWRTLFSAEARQSGPYDVIVAGSGDPVRMFDLARRHFGARTRLSRAHDPQNALSKALQSPTTLAVAPWPAALGVGSWWPALSESRFAAVSLIAALPLRRAPGMEPEAGLFASGAASPAGDDFTLMIAFDPHHRMQRAFNDVGLHGVEVSRSEPRALVRVDGFVAASDQRVTALRGLGLDGVRVLGSYANI